MRAYVDESVRVLAPGLYVLAAVVVDQAAADEVRHALRDGLRPRRRRFHWRDEEQGDREAMAKTAGELGLTSLVAVASPIDRRRQERARRLCLTRLLWELEQRDVLDVLFESRLRRDHYDQAHIRAGQRARQVSAQLRYAFGSPLVEPLLWLPDLVAGAVSADMIGQDAATRQLLGPVAVVDVGPAT